jgi:3',5'-cyclic AMP phosphodiesterase CpdA
MRIAQISDIHLKPRGGYAYQVADTAAALAKVVHHLNHLVPAPDVVLLTGDIADGGREESYDLARELLAPLAWPLFMVPGNHDHKGRLAKAFPGHAYLQPDSRGPSGDFICYAVDDYPVRLIGLDTVTPGDHGGGLCAQRLDWLEATLKERPDTPTLVFMHHPPFASAVGHMDLEPFKRREALKAIIQRHPQVERLTCGHIHRPITLRFGGSVATVCPGVGMQIPMDLRPEAPSGFVLGPPGLLVHYQETIWGDPPALLTHVELVEDYEGQFGGFHPFYDVENPKD